MKIFREDVSELSIWISCIAFIFAVGYVADGGSSLAVLLFAIGFGLLATLGILDSLRLSIKGKI